MSEANFANKVERAFVQLIVYRSNSPVLEEIMKNIEGMPHIRLAVESDCAAVTDIAAAAYAIYVERMQSKPFPMLDDYAEHIRQERVHVLEADTVICGYVVLMEKNAESLLLDNIAVLPEKQGKGYGRCLAHFADNWGKEREYNRICLYTNEVMTENLVWYQRLGYAVTHRAVENGYRRIYMAKDL